MPRQSSTKKQPKRSQDGGPAVEQERPSLKPKKMGSEIDEIFAGKKRKRPEKDNNKATAEKPVKLKGPHDGLRIVKKGKSKSLKENGLVGPTSRPRKKTADGLAVYTEDELAIGKADAGGTRLCPFKCDCCF